MVTSALSLLKAKVEAHFLGYRAICSTHLEGTVIGPYKFYSKQIKTLQRKNLVAYFVMDPFNP